MSARRGYLSLSIAKGNRSGTPAIVRIMLDLEAGEPLTIDLSAEDFTQILGGTVLRCKVEGGEA